MVRMRQIMIISVCTASSSGVVQYGVMTPDSQSRMGLQSHIQITVRAMRPSLVLDKASEPRTSASHWYGGMSTHEPAGACAPGTPTEAPFAPASTPLLDAS